MNVNVNKPKLYGDEGPAIFSRNRSVFEKAALALREEITNLSQDYDPAKRHMLVFLGILFHSIQNNPDKFDQFCSFNSKWLGEQFVGLANELAAKDLSSLDSAFSMAYRFLVEYQLMSPPPLSDSLARILDSTLEYEFDPRVSGSIKYAESQMVVRVVSDYIHHPKMVKLKNLSSLIDKSEREREVSEAALSEREERVNKLKDKLDTYKTAFNFVGLYEGFKNLRRQKRMESRIGLVWMFIVGGAMLMPPVYKLNNVLAGGPEIKLDLALGLTVTGFELLLAYFFRVALHGYRAVKAQLIQIDLRMALCQFIQDYAEYAKGIRNESPELLNKFDQLIFSGIVNNESSIPSTFDGLEHLAALIDKFKPKG
ncbi:hypothetical protein [Pseudomonas monteilii]|uniref:hypothetical protein n=1 Tax=Pseudomonas monteilii TaxID=76759 RepID=UPI0036E925E0